MAYQRRRIWLNDLNKTGVSEHAGLFFMQMISAGEIEDVAAARNIIRNSFDIQEVQA